VDLKSLTSTQLTPADHPQALDLLLKLRPEQNGETGKTVEAVVEDEKKTYSVVRFHGLPYARPDPLDDPEFREHAFDLWEPLKVGEARLLPGSRIVVPEPLLVSEKPARGGKFAEFLVDSLKKSTTGGNPFLAWQKVPPPLYQEGLKVQTPWLYQFLLEPGRIRHESVLRMPKFNMSPAEAQTLANYFAAVAGAPFPYQKIPERDPEYLAEKNQQLATELDGGREQYLSVAWKTLNAPLCIKCHSVGGRQFKAVDPKKDIRGPNLDNVSRRLRPDWAMLWLYRPNWILPYTSMPSNFPRSQTQFPDLFGGNSNDQVIGVRDALMNYDRLMEHLGKTIYEPPKTAPAETGAGE
jgi:hypothetical protein